jgi:hypothetical protein
MAGKKLEKKQEPEENASHDPIPDPCALNRLPGQGLNLKKHALDPVESRDWTRNKHKWTMAQNWIAGRQKYLPRPTKATLLSINDRPER